MSVFTVTGYMVLYICHYSRVVEYIDHYPDRGSEQLSELFGNK